MPYHRFKDGPYFPLPHFALPFSPFILLPEEKRKKRRRDWERANPTQSYKVPPALRPRALAVRRAILGLAQKYQTTADHMAEALIRAALQAVREGDLRIDFRPNPQGRKMAVEVVRGWNGTPQEIPEPTESKERVKPLVLSFRWPADIKEEIASLAGDAAPKGEMVVVLLESAVAMVREGRWGIRPRPVAVKQDVVVRFAGTREKKNNG